MRRLYLRSDFPAVFGGYRSFSARVECLGRLVVDAEVCCFRRLEAGVLLACRSACGHTLQRRVEGVLAKLGFMRSRFMRDHDGWKGNYGC